MMISILGAVCTFLVVVVGGFTTGTRAQAATGPVIKVLTAPVELGEGPHWDAAKKVLYFVDIEGHKVYQYDPRTTNLTFVSFGKIYFR